MFIRPVRMVSKPLEQGGVLSFDLEYLPNDGEPGSVVIVEVGRSNTHDWVLMNGSGQVLEAENKETFALACSSRFSNRREYGAARIGVRVEGFSSQAFRPQCNVLFLALHSKPAIVVHGTVPQDMPPGKGAPQYFSAQASATPVSLASVRAAVFEFQTEIIQYQQDIPKASLVWSE
jgi:hypothetical protein